MFAIFVFCIVFRIEGHSLKSGIIEIINILGYNVTPEPVMVHNRTGFVLSEEAFFSFTVPSQINGMKMVEKIIPAVQFQSM